MQPSIEQLHSCKQLIIWPERLFLGNLSKNSFLGWASPNLHFPISFMFIDKLQKLELNNISKKKMSLRFKLIVTRGLYKEGTRGDFMFAPLVSKHPTAITGKTFLQRFSITIYNSKEKEF